MSKIVIVIAYTAYPDSQHVFLHTGVFEAETMEDVTATYDKMIEDAREGFPKLVVRNTRIIQL